MLADQAKAASTQSTGIQASVDEIKMLLTTFLASSATPAASVPAPGPLPHVAPASASGANLGLVVPPSPGAVAPTSVDDPSSSAAVVSVGPVRSILNARPAPYGGAQHASGKKPAPKAKVECAPTAVDVSLSPTQTA